MKTRVSKFASASIGFVVGMAMVTLVSQPASAATNYDRTSAVAYAKTYACNGADCSNPAYIRLSSDCTNFVSQALNRGGLTQVKNGSVVTNWFYSDLAGIKFTGSSTWIQVSGLYNNLAANNRLSTVLYPSMGSAYSGALPGDLYMYDWGTGDGFSHFSMATSDGTFVSYYDTHEGRNYNSVTGGAGSKLAQHTVDRDGAPWNWGYQTETITTVRSQMRTRVLRIAN